MSSTTGTHSDLTPYAAAIVATAKFREANLIEADETIAPQSMYGNKTITRYGTSRRDGGDGIMFNGDSFAEWLTAQLEGRTSGTRTRVNVKALLAEYDVNTDVTDADVPADEVEVEVDPELEDAEAE